MKLTFSGLDSNLISEASINSVATLTAHTIAQSMMKYRSIPTNRQLIDNAFGNSL